MTDIVERLREAANGIGSMKTERGDYGLLDEAAAEIERLRSALNSMEGVRETAFRTGWRAGFSGAMASGPLPDEDADFRAYTTPAIALVEG